MKGSLTLDKIAVLVLTIISVAVGAGILYNLNTEQQGKMHPVERSIKQSNFPICQDFEENQTVSLKGFRTILYGRQLETCAKQNNTVELGFKLTKERLEKISGDLSNDPEVLKRENCEEIPGFNGIIVEETGSNLIGSFGDKIILKGKKPTLVCQG